MDDVLVIGAGLAGLSAARKLQSSGRRVRVLDKSRGVGGRAATRRIDGVPVDHGAQFFTVRSAAFQFQVDRWLDEGVCREWCRGFHTCDGRDLLPPSGAPHPRYACPDGMTALAKRLAEGLPIEREQTVLAVVPDAGGFRVSTREGAEWTAGSVVCSAPLPQTRALISPCLENAERKSLPETPSDPCLAVIAELPSGAAPEWKGIQFPAGPLSWIGADFSKRVSPGRRFVVLHASASFSKAHLDADLDAAAREMLEAAARVDPLHLSNLTLTHVHRWRFARTPHPLPEREFLQPLPGLYVIGDAFLTGKIESAWLSGRAAAEHLLSQ